MKPSGRQAKHTPKRKSRAPASVAIIVEEPEWRLTMPDLRAGLRRAARLALKRGGARANASLSLLLTNDAALKRLNTEFRGKNAPTNVLSFPAAANRDGYLGDIAIAYGITTREARESARCFADHARHLVVHGVLHLLGYDHEAEAEARVMERLEVAILSELGIADPYAAAAMEVA